MLNIKMRYPLLAFVALILSGTTNAQTLDKTFSIKNTTKDSITVILTYKSHPKEEKEVKGKTTFSTKFNHNDKPSLQVKTEAGDELNYQFKIPPEKDIILAFDLTFPGNTPRVKKDLSGKIAPEEIVKLEEAPAQEEAPPAVAESHEESAPPAEEPKQVPSEEPAAPAPMKEDAAPVAEAPAVQAAPIEAKKEAPAEKPSEPVKLSITPEQLLDVKAELKDEDREEFILGIDFKGTIKDATAPKGSSQNAIEKAKNAQDTVTKAYRVQLALWKPNKSTKKLPKRALEILEDHKITSKAEQDALAAATIEFIKSTYEAVKAKFNN